MMGKGREGKDKERREMGRGRGGGKTVKERRRGGNPRETAENRDFYSIFRSTPLSRPNKVGLKCPSERPSIRPHKSFFYFNEIWYVGRGQ